MKIDVTGRFITAPGVRIWQLTPDGADHSNIYPETPVWLEDGRHFLITGPDGYMSACIDGSAPSPLLPKKFADGSYSTSACISRDGRWLYFLRVKGENVNCTSALWRMDTRDLHEEHICDTPEFFEGRRPSHYYSIGTISSDGERFATSAVLADGIHDDPPVGLFVYDIPSGTCRLIGTDMQWGNAHLQYCKSTDPEASHDLLIQMNHGMKLDKDGKCILGQTPPPEGLGVDIHVIRDDGTHWRDLPWGRDGIESCIGHQAWKAGTSTCITILLQAMDPSYGLNPDTRTWIMEGDPVDTVRTESHIGRLNPDVRRRELSEGWENSRFCHFFCSEDGMHYAFDTFICEGEGAPKGDGPSPDGSPCIGQRGYAAYDDGNRLHFQYLCNVRGKFLGEHSTHAHPIITPDNSAILFNSVVTGESQVYMAEGLEWVK